MTCFWCRKAIAPGVERIDLDRVFAVDARGCMETAMVHLDDIVYDAGIYPREKWNTATIARYADALEAGAQFPPIILEEGTNRLLDGKHRLEAHKNAGRGEIEAEWRKVPDGMTARYFAATLSAQHGDRLSNADIKKIAEAEFGENPDLDPTVWGSGLGVSKSTVYRWVSHILERERASRSSIAWRLSKLGWTQQEIADKLGVTQKTISEDIQNSHLGKMYKDLGEHWNEKGISELAKRLNLQLVDCYAAAMEGMDDRRRLERLEITLQPYDVWHFQGSDDLFGSTYPGRIPGQLVAHALYFYTEPGDLVIDPMVGSGTTLDVCLALGRRCFGFDAHPFNGRPDIVEHDMGAVGWPSRSEQASLIFWDPPYYKKVDKEYGEKSVSRLDKAEYMAFFERMAREIPAKFEGRLAFLCSDYNDEADPCENIFYWDYVNLFIGSGWYPERRIQVPLSTQQVHAGIVNNFREARRLARLNRDLLIFSRTPVQPRANTGQLAFKE